MSDPASVVEGSVYAFVSADIDAAEAALFTAIPWLNAPVLGFFVNWVIQHFADELADQSAKSAAMALIRAEVAAQSDAMNTAVANLKAALAAGDPDAISKAQADANAAFDSLGHFFN